jgi:hypothetical protein
MQQGMKVPMDKKTVFSNRFLITFTTFLLVLAGSSSNVILKSTAAELFVADRATQRILAFDADSGGFSRVLVDQGLDDPVSLTMGPDGFLYVANLQSGEILKVDPTNGAQSSFVSGIIGPGGLAYQASSDSLFVSVLGNFDGELIFQYDSDGNLLDTIGTGTGATGRAGMAFDAVGDLYVSSFANDQFFSGSVLKFDSSDDFSAVGTFASGGGLAGANGLVFDTTGNLLVAGLFSQNIVKYPATGGSDSGAPFGDPLAYPSGLELAPDGNLLIASLGNNNPADPIYGNFLFPGNISKYDISTGGTIGGGPFIQARGDSLQADFVEDDLVDALDLNAWQLALGVDGSADADGDGDSDGADFLIWQSNHGQLGQFQPTSLVRYPGPSVVTQTIPEPTSWGLAILTLSSLSALRCRIRNVTK